MNKSRRSMTGGGGKRHLLFFFCLIFVFLFMSCTNRYIIWWPPVNPDSDEEPITEDVWDGTVADYSVILNQIDSGEVRIGSAAEFAAFRDIVNGQNGNSPNNFAGIDVLLEIDLDLTATDWLPIGGLALSATEASSFSGNFDGQNHVVKYKYDEPSVISSYGLFGLTEGQKEPVVIKNLTVEANITNLDVSGNGAAGILVGQSMGEVRFENCSSAPSSFLDIKGGFNSCAGGLIGAMNEGGSFIKCTNGADIINRSDSSSSYSGGLVGIIYTSTMNYDDVSCVFEECTNTGNVTSIASIAGGIAANVVTYDGGTIEFISCENQGAISGGKWAGGLIGDVQGHLNKVEDCSGCSSNIKGNEASGRFFGRLYSAGDDITYTILLNNDNGDSYDSIGTIGLLDAGSPNNPAISVLSGTLHGIPYLDDYDWIVSIAEDATWVGDGVPENPSGKTFTLSLVNGNVTITEKQ